MSAPVRKEIVLGPGESVQRSATWDADLFPAGTDALDSVTAEVVRDRGSGTLTATNVAASPDSLAASWVASLSSDAAPGSVFTITLTGAVGQLRPKMAERVVAVTG